MEPIALQGRGGGAETPCSETTAPSAAVQATVDSGSERGAERRALPAWRMDPGAPEAVLPAPNIPPPPFPPPLAKAGSFLGTRGAMALGWKGAAA